VDATFGSKTTPKSKIISIYSNFKHKNARYREIITTHWFNHKMEVFLPSFDQTDTPFTFETTRDEKQHFYYLQTSLVHLLRPEFLKNALELGLYGLSTGNWIDTGNCVCWLPQGKVIAALDKDTYQELGLSAKRAKFPIRGDRWTLTLDLAAPSFIPGKKLHERVMWAFSERVSPVELLMNFKKNSNDIYFPKEVSTVKKLSIKTKSQILPNLQIPIWDRSEIEQELSLPRKGGNTDNRPEYTAEIYAYVSSLHAKIFSYFDKTDDPNSHFVSSFCIEIDSVQKGQGQTISWKGLISTEFVETKLEQLRDLVNRKIFPWASFSVWGFEDSPVSWKECDHSVLFSGENDYTFVILPDDFYLVFVAVGEYDTFA